MTRILVVEDNKTNRYLINFILTKKGYEVINAVTGEESIELAAKEKPDLILMDIQLPGINGFEATKGIKQSSMSGNVPIIALTSYAEVGDREKAVKVFTGYIEKPINPDTFMEEIEKFL